MKEGITLYSKALLASWCLAENSGYDSDRYEGANEILDVIRSHFNLSDADQQQAWGEAEKLGRR